MNLIDTHTHLYSKEFDNDRAAMIQRCLDKGISRLYLPNVDSESIDRMLSLEQSYPGLCLPMMGLHPCSVNDTVEQELALVKEWLDKRRFAAIGEIGVDLYWDKTFIEQQRHAFNTQVQWALDYNYTISIHCRDAYDELYALLKNFGRLPRAIFHCFSGTLEQANQIIALGNFKLGIGGVVTFKNGGLDKVVEQVSLEHLVLETDAPYLAPMPYRGKRNESAYIALVAEKVAALKNVSVDEVAEITSQNAISIFEN